MKYQFIFILLITFEFTAKIGLAVNYSKSSLINVSAFNNKQKGDLSVYNLQCEGLSNPLGINTNEPRFSWKIISKKNGTEQKAFQLMVASDPSLLKRDKADLWDSKMIESSTSI